MTRRTRHRPLLVVLLISMVTLTGCLRVGSEQMDGDVSSASIHLPPPVPVFAEGVGGSLSVPADEGWGVARFQVPASAWRTIEPGWAELILGVVMDDEQTAPADAVATSITFVRDGSLSSTVLSTDEREWYLAMAAAPKDLDVVFVVATSGLARPLNVTYGVYGEGATEPVAVKPALSTAALRGSGTGARISIFMEDMPATRLREFNVDVEREGDKTPTPFGSIQDAGGIRLRAEHGLDAPGLHLASVNWGALTLRPGSWSFSSHVDADAREKTVALTLDGGNRGVVRGVGASLVEELQITRDAVDVNAYVQFVALSIPWNPANDGIEANRLFHTGESYFDLA